MFQTQPSLTDWRNLKPTDKDVRWWFYNVVTMLPDVKEILFFWETEPQEQNHPCVLYVISEVLRAASSACSQAPLRLLHCWRGRFMLVHQRAKVLEVWGTVHTRVTAQQTNSSGNKPASLSWRCSADCKSVNLCKALQDTWMISSCVLITQKQKLELKKRTRSNSQQTPDLRVGRGCAERRSWLCVQRRISEENVSYFSGDMLRSHQS